MNLKNKNIVILGLGLSGYWAAKLAISNGANIFISDNKLNVNELYVKDLKSMGVNIELGNHSNKILDSELIIKSPGVPNNIKIIQDALDKDIEVIGEIEFAYQLSDIKIIAVTGTNGKTTVVTALHSVLNQNFNVLKGGNIGIPFSQLVVENSLFKKHNYDYVILEVSSFQAEDIISFKPNIATILNLSEDHLDIHDTYNNYKNAKLNLFKNMDKQDFAIYNLDDKNLKQSFKDIAQKTNVLTFSCVENQNSNHVAVAKIASLLDIDEEMTFNFLKDFKGLEHRFEIFKKTDGITFINDSKSTNGLSIKSALSNCINLKITNIVLILGGKSKGIDYSSYIDSSSIDIKIVAYGKAADEIKNKLPNYDVDIITDFNESVHHSIKIAEEYSLNGVLLSPGCSSFDQFNNFEHRGNVFKDIVEEYYS
ncbi:MAG: UDP-N-acetylmuramoyl-L-alanine--D-glutamate ligase [Candidatus Neomarinimicrobiota bacterium]|nr:UDP-N-acetylmuramoyl-L-alanine--D-glutamate ligase [Candidatus Neomarinimicrobiota bacterium]